MASPFDFTAAGAGSDTGAGRTGSGAGGSLDTRASSNTCGAGGAFFGGAVPGAGPRPPPPNDGIVSFIFPPSITGDPEKLARMVKNIPAGRLARSEESARLAVYLASEDADFFIGQVVPFAGGWVTP